MPGVASTGPVLFMGRADSAVLVRVGEGYIDDGIAYSVLARTDRVAIAGSGGECIYTGLYLVTVHEGGPYTLHVTPVVDGAALEEIALALPGVAERTTMTHELPVSIPLLDANDVELARFAARGTWVQVQVEVRGVSGFVRSDAVEVEYEVVRETLQPGSARGGSL